jgi:hypothetical protein
MGSLTWIMCNRLDDHANAQPVGLVIGTTLPQLMTSYSYAYVLLWPSG